MEELLQSQGEPTAPESMIAQSVSTPPMSDETGGEAAPPAEAQPQPTDFNPADWPLNYKGRPISIRDKQHLTALATKGYGFDQEINRLKQREAELNERGGQYEQYDKLQQALAQNPGLQQKIFSLIQNPQAAGEEGMGDEPEYVRELRQQVQDLSAWKTSFESKMADQDIDKELNELKSKYPTHDWEAVDGENGSLEERIIAHAHNDGQMFPTLEAAYRDYMWDNRDTAVKADTLKAEEERQQKERAAGKVAVPGGGAPPVSRPGYKAGMSYNDLASEAANRMS